MTPTKWLRPLALTVTAVSAVALLAACGSSSSSSSSSAAAAGSTGPSSSARSARRAQLRACLQAHGVTLPPRPNGPGGGPPPGGGAPPGGGPPRGGGFFGGGRAPNPKLRAALQACGGFRRFNRGRFSHAAIQQYVTCVRAHGYNLPNPNFSGRGPVFPAGIRTNPRFQAASRPCQNLLFRGSGGGSSPAAGSSS